jgi:hypothetical protein
LGETQATLFALIFLRSAVCTAAYGAKEASKRVDSHTGWKTKVQMALSSTLRSLQVFAIDSKEYLQLVGKDKKVQVSHRSHIGTIITIFMLFLPVLFFMSF